MNGNIWVCTHDEYKQFYKSVCRLGNKLTVRLILRARSNPASWNVNKNVWFVVIWDTTIVLHIIWPDSTTGISIDVLSFELLMQLTGEIAYVLTARPIVFLAKRLYDVRIYTTEYIRESNRKLVVRIDIEGISRNKTHVWVGMTRNRLFALYICLFELNDFIETYALGLLLQ